MHNFTVRGSDAKGGSQELASFTFWGEAVRWIRYTSRENAGNWDTLAIYDVRDPENVTRIYYWDRGCE